MMPVEMTNFLRLQLMIAAMAPAPEIATSRTEQSNPTIVGIVFWLVAVGPLGAEGSAELVLLCWLSGAAFILLVEESPI